METATLTISFFFKEKREMSFNSDMRWLSRVTVFQQFFDLRKKNSKLMNSNRKYNKLN